MIASRLIYDRNFTKKKMGINLSYLLFPYWTIPLFLAVLEIFGVIPLPAWAAGSIILLWVLAMIPVAKVLYAPFFKRLQQMADNQSLDLALAPSLEDVLRKIDTMNIQKPGDSKALRKRIGDLHEP